MSHPRSQNYERTISSRFLCTILRVLRHEVSVRFPEGLPWQRSKIEICCRGRKLNYTMFGEGKDVQNRKGEKLNQKESGSKEDGRKKPLSVLPTAVSAV